MAARSGRKRFTERIDEVLAQAFKVGGIFLIAAIGLLMAACSTAMIVTDYKATVLYNDTTDLRAECQMADSLKPEIDWVGPGEAMLAHSGRYCAVHAADGAYVGCVRRSIIANADGATVPLSESIDTEVNRSDCAGVMITKPFDPSTFRANLAWPSGSDQSATAWIVMGYVMGGGLLGLAVFILRNTRRAPSGVSP